MFDLASWISSNAGSIEAVSTALAAIVAVVGIAIAVADGAERARPVVLPMFRRAEHSDFSIDFVVKNFGSSPAHHVSVKFDPPLDVDKGDGTTGYLVPTRYAQPVPMLAPGQELSNVWFIPKIMGNQVRGNRTTLPDAVIVTVKYRGARWWRRYSSTFKLDRTTVSWDSLNISSDSQRGRLNLMHESLKKIAKSLEQLQKQTQPSDRQPEFPRVRHESRRRSGLFAAVRRLVSR